MAVFRIAYLSREGKIDPRDAKGKQRVRKENKRSSLRRLSLRLGRDERSFHLVVERLPRDAVHELAIHEPAHLWDAAKNQR